MTWPMVKLKELVIAHYGKALKKETRDENGDVLVYGSSGDVGFHCESLTTHQTIVIGRKGSVGKVIWAPNGGWIIDTAYFLAIKDNIKLDWRYLFYVLQSLNLDAKAITTSIPGLNRDDFYDTEIPLPPLEEQKRIATILDKADAIRQKRQQAIALADQFLRSVFLDMFVNSSNEAWDIKSIEYIADPKNGGLRTGPFGSQLLHSEFVESGISVLGIDNAVENQFKWGKPRFITEEKYQTLSRYTVHPEDVLITIMGTCGRCAVVPCGIQKAINTKHLCCITLDKKKALPEFLHSYYLFHPMSQRYLAQKTKGAIMDGLNMGIIKEMPFPMVPLELQERFVSIKNATISSVSKQHLLEENQQLLFNALSKKAFSGKL